MKLTVDKKDLETSLAAVNRVIPKKGVIPVLTNVLLQAEGHLLRLAGTNLETSITTSIGVKVEEEGAVALPAQLLFDYLKTRQDGDVILEPAPESKDRAIGDYLQVRAGRNKGAMRITDAKDYPPVPEVKAGNASFIIEKAEFRALIAKVIFAVAREESRPVLTGCEVRVDGEEVSLAAADGFRLAVAKGAASTPIDIPARAVIPRGGLVELQRLLRGEGNCSVTIEAPDDPTQGRLFFDVDREIGTGRTTRLVCQLIRGNFPAYETLIPAGYGTRMRFPVGGMQGAVKTASIMARENSQIIRFVVGKDGDSPTLAVASQSNEIGRTSAVVNVGDLEGNEDVRVAVNARYIADVMPILKGDPNGVLEITDPLSPVVFRSPEVGQYTYIVMPMQIDWLHLDFNELTNTV